MFKKILLISLGICCTQAPLYAQKKPAAVNAILGIEPDKSDGSSGGNVNTVSATAFLKIKIPEGGANGAAVVYHPKEKLYYAAQAGNKEFPLIIFNNEGQIVSEEGQATRIDVRGLWYDPNKKIIAGNGYKEFGWFKYELNRKGLPEAINIFKEGRYQPDDHSPGVLNTKDDEVLFLAGLNILCYTTDGRDKNKTIQLHIGAKDANEDPNTSLTEFEETYNYKSIIYTEKKGAEIGLLNIQKKQVELYDIKTGYLTKTIRLPLSFTPESYFNFSYSNGVYWVFNKVTREWNGFKEN